MYKFLSQISHVLSFYMNDLHVKHLTTNFRKVLHKNNFICKMY